MANAVVDNATLAYRCPNETEPDGIKCDGILLFGSGQMVSQCPTCGAWTGIGAPGLVKLEVQVGAVNGARDKWTISGGSRFGGLPQFRVECGVDKCHFKRDLEAYRVHASAINSIMDQHPCPQPPVAADDRPLGQPG